MSARPRSPYLLGGGAGASRARDDDVQGKDKHGAARRAARRRKLLGGFIVIALALLALVWLLSSARSSWSLRSGSSSSSGGSRRAADSGPQQRQQQRRARLPIPESPEDVREGETPEQAAARRERGRLVDAQIAREMAEAEKVEARRHEAAVRSARQIAIEEEQRLKAAARVEEERRQRGEEDEAATPEDAATAAAIAELAQLAPLASRVKLPGTQGAYDMRRMVSVAERRRIAELNALVPPEERVLLPVPGSGVGGGGGGIGGNAPAAVVQPPPVVPAASLGGAAERRRLSAAAAQPQRPGHHRIAQEEPVPPPPPATTTTTKTTTTTTKPPLRRGNSNNAKDSATTTTTTTKTTTSKNTTTKPKGPTRFHLHSHRRDQPLLVARPHALPAPTFHKLRRDLLTSPLLYRRNELDPDSFGRTTGFVLFFGAGKGEEIVRTCPLFSFLVPFFDAVRLPQASAFVVNVLRSEPVTDAGEVAKVERAEVSYASAAAPANVVDGASLRDVLVVPMAAVGGVSSGGKGGESGKKANATATDAAADEGLVTAGAHIDDTLQQFAPAHWDTESHQTSVLYVKVPADMRGGRLELWAPDLGNSTHPKESGVGLAAWQVEEMRRRRAALKAAREAKEAAGGGGVVDEAERRRRKREEQAEKRRRQAEQKAAAAQEEEEDDEDDEAAAAPATEEEDESMGPPTRVVRPSENTIVSFRGDAMHRVLKHASPELGQVRISLVIEQYLVPVGGGGGGGGGGAAAGGAAAGGTGAGAASSSSSSSTTTPTTTVDDRLSELLGEVGAPLWVSGQDDPGRAENAVLAPWRGLWDARWGESKAAWLMKGQDGGGGEEDDGDGGAAAEPGPEPVEKEEEEAEAYRHELEEEAKKQR